ncbi:MAG: head decoration protein [Gemmatimonadaceae bacterium]
MDVTFSSSSSPTPDALLAGEMARVTQPITLLSGENRVGGSVLGKITVGAAAAAAVAGNTGNGVIGAITIGADAKVGVYKVTCIEPAANAGVFSIEDPDGVNVGVAKVAVAVVAPLGFTIADGAVDFVAGDAFDITVAAGSGKYKLAAAAATDGSQRPVGILVEDTDASAADAAASLYRTGEFNPAALTFGAGHSESTVRAPLEALQIYLRSVVAA